MVQHFAQLLLESRLSPLGLLVMIEYLEGWVAGGCASDLGCANVERVANDWIVGGVNGVKPHRHSIIFSTDVWS